MWRDAEESVRQRSSEEEALLEGVRSSRVWGSGVFDIFWWGGRVEWRGGLVMRECGG